MGAFAYLTVNDYPIFETKNSYYRVITDLLFQPEDYIVERRPLSSRNKLVWGSVYDDDKSDYIFKGFRQNVDVCKQRLQVYGTNFSKAAKDFNAAIKFTRSEGIVSYSFPIEKISFKRYLEEVKDIIQSKDKAYDKLYTNLRESLIVGDLTIEGQSFESGLYSILSVLPDDAVVEYDLTGVIDNGTVKESDVTVADGEKIIILTEGKTDVEFIAAALNKLYPHLVPYYHFINFDEYKVESHASALVKLVTSLAASNIKHHIIVLFDNDTTGIMEMNKLKAVRLPDNFRIFKYPDIRFAKKYPTIGPTGNKRMNINGSACGIELYLGEDVLTKNNALIPVQWKGYNDKENKYQGEISEKNYVHEKFREKVKSPHAEGFENMNQILQLIFKAF